MWTNSDVVHLITKKSTEITEYFMTSKRSIMLNTWATIYHLKKIQNGSSAFDNDIHRTFNLTYSISGIWTAFLVYFNSCAACLENKTQANFVSKTVQATDHSRASYHDRWHRLVWKDVGVSGDVLGRNDKSWFMQQNLCPAICLNGKSAGYPASLRRHNEASLRHHNEASLRHHSESARIE